MRITLWMPGVVETMQSRTAERIKTTTKSREISPSQSLRPTETNDRLHYSECFYRTRLLPSKFHHELSTMVCRPERASGCVENATLWDYGEVWRENYRVCDKKSVGVFDTHRKTYYGAWVSLGTRGKILSRISKQRKTKFKTVLAQFAGKNLQYYLKPLLLQISSEV